MSTPSAVVLCIIWADLFVWLPISALLWRKEFKFTAILTLLYWFSSCFWIMCRFHGNCLFNIDHLSAINSGIESSWLSAAIQLLTFELEVTLGLVQFAIITIINQITRVLLQDTYVVIGDVVVTFAVIVINWRLGAKRIPVNETSFWVVPVLITVAFFAFLVQPSDVAEIMFRRSFSLGVVFAIIEKTAWKRYGWIISTPEHTPPFISAPNSPTHASSPVILNQLYKR